MMHPYRCEQQIDDLTQIVWAFYFLQDKGVVLSEMFYMTRESKRHRFRVEDDKSYSRLEKRRYKLPYPEVPMEIQAEAVQHFRQQIKFAKEDERGFNRF
jgi:hypothetical protein